MQYVMQPSASSAHPLVSVVTPFHNTEQYLAECIESVLAQSFTNFEYILVDNSSTDQSYRLVETYAKRDPRIKLFKTSSFLEQIDNYNYAVSLCSKETKYCKFVEADNFIFPECLSLMIKAFEQASSIGLVSSYWLAGNALCGSGFPFSRTMISGKEWGAAHLRSQVHVLGSPTQVMYRSELVHEDRPFFNRDVLHADTDKCFEILKRWDFGFVPQVLSYSRVDNVSISSATRNWEDGALDRYMTDLRYAGSFFEPAESIAFIRKSKQQYYRSLARGALKLGGGGRKFWEYHVKGLRTVSQKLDLPYLSYTMALALLLLILNPVSTIRMVRQRRDVKIGR
jgi:glycosyltransferase involved in cell wall biosynthesis